MDAGMGPTSDAPEPSDAALGRRAQMLATEHWGLLAARGTAQSEVLSRITIFLTLVSAGLVTIGLLGQATAFRDWFAPGALGILAFLAVVGAMTQTRVFNVAEEDMMYVVAMNRLRVAYVDLDPGIERYFLASTTDDETAMQRTYSFLRRRAFSHLMGSSAVLISVVNALVVGLLVGGTTVSAGLPVPGAVAIGIVTFAVMLIGSMAYGFWTYREAWRHYLPLRATRGGPHFRADDAAHPLSADIGGSDPTGLRRRGRPRPSPRAERP